MYSFEYHACSFVVFPLTSLYSYLYSLKYVYEVKQPSRFCLVPKVTQSRASSPLRPDTKKPVNSARVSFYLLNARWSKHGQISAETLLHLHTRFSVFCCDYLHLHHFSHQTEMRVYARCCFCGLFHVLRHRQVRRRARYANPDLNLIGTANITSTLHFQFTIQLQYKQR